MTNSKHNTSIRTDSISKQESISKIIKFKPPFKPNILKTSIEHIHIKHPIRCNFIAMNSKSRIRSTQHLTH